MPPRRLDEVPPKMEAGASFDMVGENFSHRTGLSVKDVSKPVPSTVTRPHDHVYRRVARFVYDTLFIDS